MMDKGPSALLRLHHLLPVFFLFSSSCASSTHAAVNSSEGSSSLDVKAELSRNETPEGSIVLARVHLPEELAPSSAPIVGEFEHIEIPFYPQPGLGKGTYEGIVAIPYEQKTGKYEVKIQVSVPKRETLELPLEIVEGNYRSEVLKVKPGLVNPDEKDLPRIEKEVAEVGALYSRITKTKYWKGPFRLPIKSAVTSPYGSKRVYNGEMKSYHGGVDLKAPMKSKIFSAAAGEVVLAKNLYYTGNTVMIDHGYGIFTLYAHLTKLLVKEGQLVGSHTLVGLSGKTGRVTGPHLHWQAVVHHVKVNPMDLLQVMR